MKKVLICSLAALAGCGTAAIRPAGDDAYGHHLYEIREVMRINFPNDTLVENAKNEQMKKATSYCTNNGGLFAKPENINMVRKGGGYMVDILFSCRETMNSGTADWYNRPPPSLPAATPPPSH